MVLLTMASTVIQVLHFLSESTIDKPSTVAFKQWREAIDYLVGCTGVSDNSLTLHIVHEFIIFNMHTVD